MTENNQTQLGNTLWKIADELRGAMNADQFRDYMLSFLFLRYLSDNYEAAAKKELGKDYPAPKGSVTPLAKWYKENPKDINDFEKQMRRKEMVQPFDGSKLVGLVKFINITFLDTLFNFSQ